MIELEFISPPPLAGAMIKALVLPRKGFNGQQGLPDIRARWVGVKADEVALARYCDVLSVPHGQHLPVLYPHVLAGAMHMNMLTHKDFPIRLLGAVHLKNTITQYAAIATDQVFDLHSQIAHTRITEKGVEFDFNTQVVIDDKAVWEETSTYFMAGKYKGELAADGSFELTKLEVNQQVADWFIPANRGKVYASITGDYNPIHMSATLAKLFGFKRDIAHGFGVLAQSLEQSGLLSTTDYPLTVQVIFKGPLYLRSQVILQTNNQQDSQRFDVFCGENPKPSMCVKVAAL